VWEVAVGATSETSLSGGSGQDSALSEALPRALPEGWEMRSALHQIVQLHTMRHV